LKRRPEYSFKPEETIVSEQKVPVVFEETDGKDLFVKTDRLGLARDCPMDEIAFWENKMQEKRKALVHYLKAPKRAVNIASEYTRGCAESFLGDEYELDKFQIEDLKESIDEYGWNTMTADTRNIVDTEKYKKELEKSSREVRKEIDSRMKKRTIIIAGIIALMIYLAGYTPYLIGAGKEGSNEFLSSLLLALLALLFVAVGGLLALLALRKRLRRKIEKFNSFMQNIVNCVKTGAKKFEEYLSNVCTYMKAQSVLIGIVKKDNSISSEKFLLRAHKHALEYTIGRDEEWAAAYDLNRIPEAETNVLSFFDPDIIPKENYIYRFTPNTEPDTIPINSTGDMITAPYSFISKILIAREEIYESGRNQA